ncbi:FHA domain-containing protein [Calycomorphotria hydatis]|uniref:FHA domain protein n=1 Tax=Calycomorphotria hydatis TaxID=2528027 RepID=A0A517TA92_9PLAN|nr:FHA domain-containing protein [Calycomorphotria hydatis]QDT65291.1 FHA domain protein [Calycomorphotria hydatis]
MRVYLEVADSSKSNVKRITLRNTTTIGRSKNCDLRIASSRISRKHCRLVIADGVVRVTDLGSSNGTFIDSDRILEGESGALLPDATLSIAGIKFRVRYNVNEDAQGSDPEYSTMHLSHEDVATATDPSVVHEGGLGYTASVSDDEGLQQTSAFEAVPRHVAPESNAGIVEAIEAEEGSFIQIRPDSEDEDEMIEVIADELSVDDPADSEFDMNVQKGEDSVEIEAVEQDEEDFVADILMAEGDDEESSAGDEELGEFLKQFEEG